LSLEVGPATAQLKRLCGTERQFAIFQTFLAFNRNILKTNFYKPGKAALSFRLQADFLSPTAYPIKPYGVFFVVGAEFRGFHVRFSDVARGGIRIVRSRFMQDFVNNVSGIFDEAYNLASTQQRKNKDIPEGGSKGVILLNFSHQDKDRVAFEKYVDALMDLLLPHPTVDDKLGKPEILFLGPDEGTAHMMDWASLHANKRGYGYWKAFTTGKSVILGGIPHDSL
jgi:glutamate dehydrogenase